MSSSIPNLATALAVVVDAAVVVVEAVALPASPLDSDWAAEASPTALDGFAAVKRPVSKAPAVDTD